MGKHNYQQENQIQAMPQTWHLHKYKLEIFKILTIFIVPGLIVNKISENIGYKSY